MLSCQRINSVDDAGIGVSSKSDSFITTIVLHIQSVLKTMLLRFLSPIAHYITATSSKPQQCVTNLDHI
jgi:hypothetical protein